MNILVVEGYFNVFEVMLLGRVGDFICISLFVGMI